MNNTTIYQMLPMQQKASFVSGVRKIQITKLGVQKIARNTTIIYSISTRTKTKNKIGFKLTMELTKMKC